MSLFTEADLPAVAGFPDSSAVELGMRFSTSTPGAVTGVRFFKGAGNTGTHTGSVWDAAGHRLATADFIAETAIGWQQATFAKPVRLAPGAVYTVSYFARSGHYAVTENFFTSAVTRGPLRSTPAVSAGVFAYAASSSFPAITFQASNYWVDVVFTPAP